MSLKQKVARNEYDLCGNKTAMEIFVSVLLRSIAQEDGKFKQLAQIS